jgi:hypothetical protein
MHLHYSPYQFSSSEQLAEPKKQIVKEKKFLMKSIAERKSATRNLGCTMTRDEAHEVCSLPNAFISPNLPDVMRQSKSVFSFAC